jgi:hypothetical protein
MLPMRLLPIVKCDLLGVESTTSACIDGSVESNIVVIEISLQYNCTYKYYCSAFNVPKL